MAISTYYYNEQIKRYVTQFMAIFAGLEVAIGKNDDSDQIKLISVPIQYGNKDRVSAYIKSDHTQNKPLRIPMMSAYINGINMSPELRKGIGATKRQSHLPRGGLFPDDITTVHQYMPVPYKLQCEVAIYASNTDQHFQILEQILMMFDPMIQIQTTDNLFDWTKLTTVELEGINFDQNYPIGTDRRMITSTLNFAFPVYISAPVNLRNDFIKDIYVRIGTVSQATDLSDSEEVVAELDGQGIDYENWFSLDDINLP